MMCHKFTFCSSSCGEIWICEIFFQKGLDEICIKVTFAGGVSVSIYDVVIDA